MQWYVRHRETESSERFFAPAMGPERGLQPRICNRVIRADDMPEGAPVTDIVVSKGSVYQMTTQEKKKKEDWVMSKTKYLLMLTLLKKVLL